MIDEERAGENNSHKLSETSSQREQAAEIHYTKNKKIVYWLYLLLGALFVSAQGYLVAKNWQQMQVFYNSDNFFYSNQVAYEWKQGFITDVQVTAAADCPSGYEHAVNFKWPGSGYGCFCKPSVNTSFVLEGYCTPLLIQSSCRNIESQSERVAHLWRNSSNICVKRSTVSFATEEKYNGNNKICGSSQSLVIVPQSEPCPLVNLTFSEPRLEDHYTQMSDRIQLLQPLFGSYNATSPYSFYSYPITKFTVSESEFCLLDDDSGLTSDHQEFVLLNFERGCEEPGSYQTLDELTEISFYANNPTLDSLASIEGFPKPGNWVYKFGFSSLPSWTYYCRHNYDGKFSVPRAIQILNFQFYTGYYYIALVQVLLLAVLGGQIFILGLRRLLKREVYPTGYRQVYLPKDFCLAAIRYFVDLFCKAIIFSLAMYSTWVCAVNWNWFKSAINLECADRSAVLTTHVIEPFRDMYERGMVLLLGQMVVLICVLVVDIVHLCYAYRNELQYYLVDPQFRKIVEVEQDKELDWLKNPKLDTDNKVLQFEDLADDSPDNASDKFRITMAMNGFEQEKSFEEDIPSRGKVLKKKKKKIGGIKREEKKEASDSNAGGLAPSDEFNPYSFEDGSFMALNSRDTLTRNQTNDIDEEGAVRERRQVRGRGRGRGRR